MEKEKEKRKGVQSANKAGTGCIQFCHMFLRSPGQALHAMFSAYKEEQERKSQAQQNRAESSAKLTEADKEEAMPSPRCRPGAAEAGQKEEGR